MITQPGHASWRFAETGSRGAVLRRSEGTRFSSRSDDEVGGTKARSGPAMFAPLICRRSRRNASRCRADSPTQSFRRSRRRQRLPGEHRREHSEPSDTASAASGAIRHGSRGAVLSQAGAPLSWTSRARRHAFPNQLHLRQLTEAGAHNTPQQDIECLDAQDFGVRGRQTEWIMTQ